MSSRDDTGVLSPALRAMRHALCAKRPTLNPNPIRNPMNYREIVERIRRLDIPARAKAELMMLWHRCKRLVERILQFMDEHRDFTESMLLGAIAAFLLSQIPWIGGFLALCALVTAAAIGVLKQIHADLTQLFETPA